MPIKTRRLFIDGVDDDGEGSDLRCLSMGAVQRVHEQKLACALPSLLLIDGEPAEKRCRQNGIARKLLRHIDGQLTGSNAE